MELVSGSQFGVDEETYLHHDVICSMARAVGTVASTAFALVAEVPKS